MGMDWSAIVLAVLYLLLCLFVVFQITRILIGRHSILRFQFGFLVLCFLWTLFRVIFWFSGENWPPLLINFIYWIPVWVQFATFSLLVMFYCSVLYKYSWDHHMCCCRFLQAEVEPIRPDLAPWSHCQRRHIFFIVFWIINVIFFTFYTVWTIVQAEQPELALRTMGSIITGVLFLFLMAILVFYAHKMSQMVHDTQPDNPLNKVAVLKGQINNRMVLFSYVIAGIFTIRSIYDFVSSFNESIREWGSLYSNGMGVAPFGFCMFIFWEIIPTTMILLQFQKIPNSSDRRRLLDVPDDSLPRLPFGKTNKELPTAALPPASVKKNHRFKDPNRYDSDEESLTGTSLNPSNNLSYGAFAGDTFCNYSFSPASNSSTTHSYKNRYLQYH